MSELTVVTLVVASLVAGFVSGWLIKKQNEEIDLLKAENEFQEKLVQATKRIKELEQGYRDLLLDLTRLKKAGNAAGADEFNRVWAEIRKKLQSH